MTQDIGSRNIDTPYLVSYFIEAFWFYVQNEVLAQEPPDISVRVTRSGTGDEILPYETMTPDENSPPLLIEPVFTL